MAPRFILPILCVLAGAAITIAADPKAKTETAKKVKRLIDELANVSTPGIGYSGSVSGTVFLPLDENGRIGTILLGQQPIQPSEPMRDLVKLGAVAVPFLIEHLDDQRPTQIAPFSHPGGFGGMWHSDICDFNARTQKKPEDRKEQKKEQEQTIGGSGFHRITVGDLCYVALGQIVNRQFDAIRYQPTAIIIVSSPVRSRTLREAVKEHWADLTPEKHKDSLIDDIEKPDSEYRRIGAAKRLAYYYPDALEEPAMKVLVEPSYDGFDVQTFVRKKLYAAKNAEERKKLLDDYLASKHGPYQDGVLRQLFADLSNLEANEEGRLFPPLKEYSDQPRRCLIELFSKPKSVKSKDGPTGPDLKESVAKAQFIREALIYDRNRKLDRAVCDLLFSIKEDDYLASACAERLVGRGYDREIEKYFRSRPAEASKEVLARIGWTPVHVAVSRGDIDALVEVISTGANIGAAAKNGDTPLHIAVAGGDARLVRALVSAKAVPDVKNKADETPVQIASRDERWDLARILVECGATAPDVFVAAATGDADQLRQFLKRDRTAATRQTKSEITALHLAAAYGHSRVARALLEANAVVDAADSAELTPLHYACTNDQVAVARLLIDHKAAVTKPAGEGGPTPLHLAASSGSLKIVELLLARGANSKAKANGGQTALHYAARRDQPEIIKLLVKSGTAVDAMDEQRDTPLHAAAEAGSLKAVETLLALGASVKTKGNGGLTPLHLAAQQGHREVAALLLRHNADPLVDTVFGGTPLDMARRVDDPNLIKLLEEAAKKR